MRNTFLLGLLLLAFTANAEAQEHAYAFGTLGGGATGIDLPAGYVLSGPRLPQGAQDSPGAFCGHFFISSPTKNTMAFLSCRRLGFQDRIFQSNLSPEDQALSQQRSHLDRLTAWSGGNVVILSCPPAEQVNAGQAHGWLQIINHKAKDIKVSMGGSPFKGMYHSPPVGQPLSCVAIACVIVGGQMVFEIKMHGPTEESTRSALLDVLKSLSIPTSQATSEALSKQGRIDCSLTLKSKATLQLNLPPGHIPDQNVDPAKGTLELSFLKEDAVLRFARVDGATSVIMWQVSQQGKRHEAGSLFSSPMGWIAARASNYRIGMVQLQLPPVPFSTQVLESDSVDVISTRFLFRAYGHVQAAICVIKTDGGDVLHCTVMADTRAQLDEILASLSQAKYTAK
jgi:hypothetical protein